MPASTYDPFATSSGLSDIIQGVITDAWFGTDNNYNDGQSTVLKLTVNDPELGEQELMFPCGGGWEAGDGGETVHHPAGARNYNKQSGCGLMLDSAMANGLGDTLRATGHTPFEAALWKGLDLVFERKEFEFKTKDGETHSYHRMLPVAAGATAKGAKGAKGAKKAPAKATKATNITPDEDSGETGNNPAGSIIANLTAKERGQMKAIAAGCEDNERFVEKLYTADLELPDDPEFETAAFDGTLFNALKG